MTTPFEPSRADGRSDRQIVYNLAYNVEPETQLSHQALVDALAEGLLAPPPLARVYRAVKAANDWLLRENKRYLHTVRGRGYKVLRADEMLPAALGKKRTAESYIQRGVEILNGTRLDELPAPLRTVHQGQLMIMAGLHGAIQESRARHNRQEELIEDLRVRIKKVEGHVEGGAGEIDGPPV